MKKIKAAKFSLVKYLILPGEAVFCWWSPYQFQVTASILLYNTLKMCCQVGAFYITNFGKVMFYFLPPSLNGQSVYKFTEARKWGKGGGKEAVHTNRH